MSPSLRCSSFALFALGLSLGSTGAVHATVHDVVVQSLSFSPADLQIDVGDTVHWVWTVGSHTVTSGGACTPDGLFNNPLNSSNPEFSFTFDDPGLVDYHCIPHCGLGMIGTIEVSDVSGVPGTTSVSSLSASVSPNPFSSGTEIHFSLAQEAPAKIEIFDASGRRTAFFGDVGSAAGSYSHRWNGDREDGTKAPAGIYYALISANTDSQVVRLVKID